MTIDCQSSFAADQWHDLDISRSKSQQVSSWSRTFCHVSDNNPQTFDSPFFPAKLVGFPPSFLVLSKFFKKDTAGMHHFLTHQCIPPAIPQITNPTEAPRPCRRGELSWAATSLACPLHTPSYGRVENHSAVQKKLGVGLNVKSPNYGRWYMYGMIYLYVWLLLKEVENLQSIVSLFLDFLQKILRTSTWCTSVRAFEHVPVHLWGMNSSTSIFQVKHVQRGSWNPPTPWFLGEKNPPTFHRFKIACLFPFSQGPRVGTGATRTRVTRIS